jgi:hypothetical protein
VACRSAPTGQPVSRPMCRSVVGKVQRISWPLRRDTDAPRNRTKKVAHNWFPGAQLAHILPSRIQLVGFGAVRLPQGDVSASVKARHSNPNPAVGLRSARRQIAIVVSPRFGNRGNTRTYVSTWVKFGLDSKPQGKQHRYCQTLDQGRRSVCADGSASRHNQELRSVVRTLTTSVTPSVRFSVRRRFAHLTRTPARSSLGSSSAKLALMKHIRGAPYHPRCAPPSIP